MRRAIDADWLRTPLDQAFADAAAAR
jgi:hypothetical protein